MTPNEREEAFKSKLRESISIGNTRSYLEYKIKTADSDVAMKNAQEELDTFNKHLEEEKRKQAKAGEDGYNDLGNQNHKAPGEGNSNPLPQNRSR